MIKNFFKKLNIKAGLLHFVRNDRMVAFCHASIPQAFRTSYKKVAFTLAEVLITLGIIGVVAAMTIPTLMNKISERQTVTKLVKVYATLQQAYQYSTEEYGNPATWGITTRDKETAVMIRKNLFFKTKYSVDCDDTEDFTKCGFWNGYNGGVSTTTSTALQLIDGTSISILPNQPGSSYFIRGEKKELKECWSWIDVYLHTRKDKNDFFRFFLTSYGIIPVGDPESTIAFIPSEFQSNETSKAAYWVLKYRNMDYLHCPEKLSWEGKHSCKEK